MYGTIMTIKKRHSLQSPTCIIFFFFLKKKKLYNWSKTRLFKLDLFPPHNYKIKKKRKKIKRHKANIYIYIYIYYYKKEAFNQNEG